MDTTRNRLIVWGGGHSDYSGNELYALDLNNLSITRLTAPGVPVASACPESIVNGTQPNSRHTYDGIEYMPNVDRLWIFGGSLATCGYANQGTWMFSFSTNQWENKNPTGTLPRGDLGIVSAYDPNTGKVFVHDSLDLYAYDSNTNSYQKLTNNGTGIDYHMTAAIDPKRKKFVIIGGTGTNGGGVVTYDIGSGSSYARQRPSTSGGAGVINTSSPGLAYDPVSDRMVAWNGGNTVYSLNLDTNTWTGVSYSGGPAAVSAGTFGRWQYSPVSDVFVSINDADLNATIFRLNSVSSPVSDTTAPSIPSGLVGTAISSSQINLSWSGSIDNVATAGYRVYRGGTQVAAVTSTSYQDTNLSSSTTYSYAVAAFDAAGNVSSQSSTMSATTLAVTALPPSSTGSATVLVKFGKTSALNSFGLSGWSTIIKDAYTDYQDIGPGGTTIVIGDNYTYNYQGISGTPRNFISDEKIRVAWYNNSGTAATFTPNISFNDPDRISMGTTGTWYPMTSVTVPAFGSAVSEYAFTSASAGSFALVNVNVNYQNNQVIIADRIELVTNGSTTPPPPGTPTILLSASPSSISSGGSSTLNWSSINATSCTASGAWSGTKATSGSQSTGNLTTNSVFALTCTGAGGSVSQSVTLTISTSLPPSGNTLVYFTLTSPTTGVKPFAMGQAFKQGDIPAGQTITTSDATDFQATIKNTWPDGSARFAIVAGRASLTANTPKTINLTAGTDLGGTTLTESDLLNTSITASIQFGSVGTVNLTNLIGVASTLSGGRMTNGRVRTWISGPKMSSWIYYSRIGTDAHLSAWFEVRLWSDGSVEVLPWVENSTLNVASPSGKAAATVTFTLGGSQRYSGTLTMGHHTRAVLASGSTFSHWLGTDATVIPRHDTAYLQATKMMPNYRGVTSSSSPLWSRITRTYTPMTAANTPYAGMGGTGYGIFIGLLPEWDVAYLTGSGDSRALASVQANAYAAGFLDTHFRDETTNQPIKFSSYPNLVIGGGENIGSIGSSSTSNYTPTASGASGGNWDIAHHPSLGYMAYLLLGRFYFLEESQFVATVNFLANTDTNRQFIQGVLRTDAGTLIPRGAAWAMRSLAQVSAITPDGEALATEFINSVASNIVYYHNKYVAQSNNPQGFVKSYDDYTPGVDPWMFAPWMDDFFTASWGYAKDIVPGLSGTNQTKLSEFFNWKANAVIGRLGVTAPTEYYFADAAQYNLPIAPSDSSNFDNGTGPFYATFGAVYSANFGVTNPQAPVDGNLRGGNFPDGTSYWGNLQPAISYAVNHGVSGALTAYNRMIGAGNWSMLTATFNDNPIWGVAPLTLTPVTPPPTVGSAPNAPSSLSIQ